jgi:WD40 repeat protein
VLLVSTLDGKVVQFDVRNASVHLDTISPAAVTCARWAHDGRSIVASCADSTVRLMDAASGQLLGSMSGHVCKNVHMPLRLDCLQQRVWIGSEDGNLVGWDLRQLQSTAGRASADHKAVLPAIVKRNVLATRNNRSTDGSAPALSALDTSPRDASMLVCGFASGECVALTGVSS